MKSLSAFLMVVCFFLSFQPKAQAFDINRRVAITRQVLIERMSSVAPIPTDLLQRAQCIAVMRNVKAGFIFGGEGSTGLLTCRTQDGWSAPSFLNTGGASFGLLIGGQVVDNVLLFMSPYARQALIQGSVQLGGELTIAAGPVGQGVGAAVAPGTHVLVYSSGKGLYGGISLNGIVMAHAEHRNQIAYGRFLSPAEILSTPSRLAPPALQPFLQAVEWYTQVSPGHYQ
jgi:SH3 domain-containing YSC84-like protein 1